MVELKDIQQSVVDPWRFKICAAPPAQPHKSTLLSRVTLSRQCPSPGHTWGTMGLPYRILQADLILPSSYAESKLEASRGEI